MSDKNKNRTTEYVARGVVAGTLGGMSASMYYADKKPKNMVPRKPGLKTPTAKSMAKLTDRLTNSKKLLGAVVNDAAMNSGKTKVGYSPKQGTFVREPTFDQKRLNQINKSFLSGKPQAKTSIDQRSAKLGNRMRRVGAAMDSPKNKAIRTMGKVLNVVRGGSAIGAISYAASSTPVGDATIHKGFQQKAFKKSDRPLKLPK